MPDLNKTLQLQLKGAKKIAILGIGSDLRGDDVAGVLIAEELKKFAKGKQRSLQVFVGSTAPENFTGVIKKFNPTHLILIDTADINKKPGTIMLIDPAVVSGISFSTHQMPTRILVDYITHSIDCKIIIIGIQPKSLEFGGEVSHVVEHAVEDVAAALKKALAKNIGSAKTTKKSKA